ncbi:MAG: DUF169 domain-containing protein [bacterium]|nr:MAG: DUF169 domain-containing protein [bacterium]
MPPTSQDIKRLKDKLQLDTPIIAVYDSAPGPDSGKLVEATGRTCCFAYFKQWLDGKTVVFRRGKGNFSNPKNGCPGGQIAFGLEREYPPFMAHFLTDGKGAPMGEGLKATPELAQKFLDRARPPELSGDTVLVGPLDVTLWTSVRSVTFLADPDRLSALMTLAAYWSSDPELVVAPFSSGCGMLLRELESMDSDRVIIGCTDIAMRKYIPPDILSLTVTPKRFEQMCSFPDDAFLNRSWWNELLKSRRRGPHNDR